MPNPGPAPLVFDRGFLRKRRDRLADRQGDHDFLIREIQARLVDRLADISPRHFGRALELGCGQGQWQDALPTIPSHISIGQWVHCDLSVQMVTQNQRQQTPRAAGLFCCADEELLPFAPESFDLIIAPYGLGWVNDLPGSLAQIRHCLKPDGLFLGAILGGQTLAELREALTQAELDLRGGIHQRFSPIIDNRDCAALMQRAGFALPLVDSDHILVQYRDIRRLLGDISAMGFSNATANRPRGLTTPRLLAAAMGHYQQTFTQADGAYPAHFEAIFLHGWAPHLAQPKPQRRGSAQVNLADFLDQWDGNMPESLPEPSDDSA